MASMDSLLPQMFAEFYVLSHGNFMAARAMLLRWGIPDPADYECFKSHLEELHFPRCYDREVIFSFFAKTDSRGGKTISFSKVLDYAKDLSEKPGNCLSVFRPGDTVAGSKDLFLDKKKKRDKRKENVEEKKKLSDEKEFDIRVRRRSVDRKEGRKSGDEELADDEGKPRRKSVDRREETKKTEDDDLGEVPVKRKERRKSIEGEKVLKEDRDVAKEGTDRLKDRKEAKSGTPSFEKDRKEDKAK